MRKLHSKCYDKHIVCIIPFELHNFNRWVVISSSSSIEKKLRHRLFTQGHVAGKWQRYNQNAGLSDSATCALNQYTILFLASFHQCSSNSLWLSLSGPKISRWLREHMFYLLLQSGFYFYTSLSYKSIQPTIMFCRSQLQNIF